MTYTYTPSTKDQLATIKSLYQKKYPGVFSDKVLIEAMNEYILQVKNKELVSRGIAPYVQISSELDK